jgi:hypothetical protein
MLRKNNPTKTKYKDLFAPAVLPAQVLALRQRLTRQRLRASAILGAFFSPSCDGGKLAASASFTCC